MSDVGQIMTAALESPEPLHYRLPSIGACINFRQRCYKWRTEQHRLAAERFGEVPGIAPPAPYEVLTLSVHDALNRAVVHNNQKHVTPAQVHLRDAQAPGYVRLAKKEATGVLETESGERVQLGSPASDPDSFDLE